MNKIQIPCADSFPFYPTAAEVDAWAAALLLKSQALSVTGSFLDAVPIRHEFGNGPNALENRFIRFDVSDNHSFFGYWQPAAKGPAPLLVNFPGYGGYMSMHPQISDDGYHILHLSPLGYVAPEGPKREIAMEDGNWPVLHNTAMGICGGYHDWLLDCLLGIRWMREQPGVIPDRISLYGTSQGGGASLLVASILRDDIRCVCADLPFLTAFPLSGLKGEAYGILRSAFESTEPEKFWNRLGYIDTTSHAHRLTMPIMLSAGGRDDVCPQETIEFLFSLLPGTKQYTFLENNVHTHSRQSMFLFRSWLAMFS